MSKTLTGIFDDASQASKAQEELVARGFTKEDIIIKTAICNPNTKDDDHQVQSDNAVDWIDGFFKNLFSDIEQNLENNADTVLTATIVTLHIDDSDQAIYASKILYKCGAIDVNESVQG